MNCGSWLYCRIAYGIILFIILFFIVFLGERGEITERMPERCKCNLRKYGLVVSASTFLFPPFTTFLNSNINGRIIYGAILTIFTSVGLLVFVLWIEVSANNGNNNIEPGELNEDEPKIIFGEVNESVRDKTRLIAQSTYFSLATMGVIANILFRNLNANYSLLIATFGVFVSFAFTTFTVDLINDRKDLLNYMSKTDFGESFSDVIDPDKQSGLFPTVSSTHIPHFHYFMLLLWSLAYLFILISKFCEYS